MAWGFFIIINGVIYLLVRVKQRNAPMEGFGLLSLLEIVNFLLINGLITTVLFGGL